MEAPGSCSSPVIHDNTPLLIVTTAGDYVKFSFPMAWSVTTLNWGILEFTEGYQEAGELDRARDGVRWPLNWLMKANPDPATFYCQVGDWDV